ncbi:hypothetical protein LAZ67_1006870 [Cordylochernes scorpioides]|uniref:RNA-directed DNA polymerase n=1 Tax=Cordylochernes scorpioides TaxID=51811 RepID=A0ABY6K3R5_9ARAC|nr:hypothetical protein LAZ67_1006870 [Cordylochernes scorpioides]
MQDATTEQLEGPTSTAPSQLSRLAFRAPPFWPNDVELWISQLEAAFGLAGISRDETKFQATVTSLDQPTLTYVADIVTAPPPSAQARKCLQPCNFNVQGKRIRPPSVGATDGAGLTRRLFITDRRRAYLFLVDTGAEVSVIPPPVKNARPSHRQLFAANGQSKQTKILQVLDGRPIEFQKPSTVLAAMQHQAGRNFSDTVLKILWTRRLPQDIRAALAASSETSLSKLAEMADNIHEAILPTVSAVDQPSSGHSAEAHQQLFDRLRDYGLTINETKCTFGQPSVKFLGFIITNAGISPDPQRVQAIKDIPIPDTVGKLRRFLGMLNFYRRCLPNAASTQAPLHAMVEGRKNASCQWTPTALQAFDQKLDAAQRKYSAYGRELLAVYLAIKHFRHLLEGRQFPVYTDHKPLTYAFQQNLDKASPRQCRHLDFIGQFTTDIRYIAGCENVPTDFLSRVEPISHHQPYDPKSLAEAPFVPASCRRIIFSAYHNLSHPGVRATTRMVTAHYVWPAVKKDCALWTRACHRCQVSKTTRHTRTPLQSFSPPDGRFSHVHIDLVGPLPPSENYRYIFTCVDRFTRWPEALPIQDNTAKTVANAFLSVWISRFGVPAKVTTDQGSQFESALFGEFTRLLGNNRIRISPYYPAANGLVERFHRQLKDSLRCHDFTSWSLKLPLVLLGIRSSLREDLNTTTAELVYGKPLPIPGTFFEDPPSASSPKEPWLEDFKRAMASLKPAPTKPHGNRHVYVPKPLETCSHVYLRRYLILPPLAPPYDGPYEVLFRKPKICKLKIEKRSTWVSFDRLMPAFTSEGPMFSQDPNLASQ